MDCSRSTSEANWSMRKDAEREFFVSNGVKKQLSLPGEVFQVRLFFLMLNIEQEKMNEEIY